MDTVWWRERIKELRGKHAERCNGPSDGNDGSALELETHKRRSALTSTSLSKFLPRIFQ